MVNNRLTVITGVRKSRKCNNNCRVTDNLTGYILAFFRPTKCPSISKSFKRDESFDTVGFIFDFVIIFEFKRCFFELITHKNPGY